MPFDITDPYEAADCWLYLTCERCYADLECPAAEGLEHFAQFHVRGQYAKQLGWYVADESTPTGVAYRVFCSGCAATLVLQRPDPGLRREPHPSVRAVAGLDALG